MTTNEGANARSKPMLKPAAVKYARHPLYTFANPAIVTASTTLGDDMDDDKPVLDQVTDAVSSAATATSEAAKTVVKKVKKAAKKVGKAAKKAVTKKAPNALVLKDIDAQGFFDLLTERVARL